VRLKPGLIMATTLAHPSELARGPRGGLTALTLGAVGVVFGDIGTSPLYAMKESFIGAHPLAVDPAHIFGVLSLIFWTMTLVVTIKYVFIILRADNRGEGGSLALLALLSRSLPGGRRTQTLALLGVLATALFYGDAILTPAISVLSAVEGLSVVSDRFTPFVLPIAAGILVGLFMIQSRGTARVGILFGPIVLVYFAVLAVLGISQIVSHPEILGIVNPWWAMNFFLIDPKLAFLALGSVVLAITGAEALYADLGHFGRRPIAIAWLYVAFPCLLLNYMGQGALLLSDPAAAENPFFLMAPEWSRLPLVVLACMATIIASQAVITGAYSITQQAVQLGFLPRFRILHTSEKAAGQIYIPAVNWALLVLVLVLVLTFRQSTALAAAYGIAVTGTMFITTLMLGVLMFAVWKWNRWLAGTALAVFLIVDGAYLASNLTKFMAGGWVPILIGAIAFILLTTWSSGRAIMRERMGEGAMPAEVFIRSCAASAHRVRGTAVFLSSNAEGIPSALLHNMKHNQVLHERVLILTVQVDEVPHVPAEERVNRTELGYGFHRVVLRHGFMDEVDVPADLARLEGCGPEFRMMETSFFLGRQTLIPSARPGMALWREKLFAWMMQNSESAMLFFKLPSNRVVELGSQVEI
jgi:KUP system potassium uptake protein